MTQMGTVMVPRSLTASASGYGQRATADSDREALEAADGFSDARFCCPDGVFPVRG